MGGIDSLNEIKNMFNSIEDEILKIKIYLSKDDTRREIILKDLEDVTNKFEKSKNMDESELLNLLEYILLKVRILSHFYRNY